MDLTNLPAGYCFLPTAEQLLMQYLLPRKNDMPVPGGDRLLRDVNLYGKHDPWTLFGVTDGSQECCFFVFTDLNKLTEGNGRLRRNGRKSRAAGSGVWWNRAVNDVKDSEGRVIGIDRYYTFCTGDEKKKPKPKPKKERWHSGSNTDDDDDDDHGRWTMHEYSLVDSTGRCFDDVVVCAIACNSHIVIKHSAAPGNSKKRRMSAIQSSTELGETSWIRIRTQMQVSMKKEMASNVVERHRIGYALEPKKVQSFIKPSLLDLASERGIDLIRIDPEKPLSEQGPFDCIIHKLYGQDWKLQLREFSAKNPNVPVIDSPDSIEKLHNRISMLYAVTKLQISKGFKDFGIPNQVVVFDKEGFVDSVRGLKFPVVAKHLMADGSPDSHKMLLVFDKEGLDKVDTPVVLQEFVNHGGFIFKVYVVGEHVTCVKRKSLPDISEEKLKTLKGSISFSQISNLATSSAGSDELNDEKAEMPPLGFIVEFARAMGEALGLNLFNFDVIRDAKEEKNRYLVIDINYFPGYAKMPSFESVLTDFFLEIVHKKKCKETGEVADDNTVNTTLELCAGKW